MRVRIGAASGSEFGLRRRALATARGTDPASFPVHAIANRSKSHSWRFQTLPEETMKMKKQDLVSRRTVLKGAAAATAASTFNIVNAKSVRGTAANSMVEIGFVGCGGQGTRDSQLLEATGKA